MIFYELLIKRYLVSDRGVSFGGPCMNKHNLFIISHLYTNEPTHKLTHNPHPTSFILSNPKKFTAQFTNHKLICMYLSLVLRIHSHTTRKATLHLPFNTHEVIIIIISSHFIYICILLISTYCTPYASHLSKPT